MITKKTYTPISQIPDGQKIIGKCSVLLPNSMQCWRSGDVLVETESTSPAIEDGGEPVVRVTSAQFCYAHSQAEQQKDAADEAAAQEVLAQTAQESHRLHQLQQNQI